MDNAFGVRCFKRFGDLDARRQELIELYASAFNAVLQGKAL